MDIIRLIHRCPLGRLSGGWDPYLASTGAGFRCYRPGTGSCRTRHWPHSPVPPWTPGPGDNTRGRRTPRGTPSRTDSSPGGGTGGAPSSSDIHLQEATTVNGHTVLGTVKSVTSARFVILTIRTFNIFRQATGQGVLAPEQTEWTLLFNGHQIPAFPRVADDKAVAATRVVRVSQPAIYSATSAQFCKTHI